MYPFRRAGSSAFMFAALLFGSAAFAACLYWLPPKTSADMAAWVQAVGSVAAILAAVWIASSQRREAAEQVHRELAARIDGLAHIVKRLERSIEDCYSLTNPTSPDWIFVGSAYTEAMNRFYLAHTTLNRMPLDAALGEFVIASIFEAQSLADEAAPFLERLSTVHPPTVPEATRLESWIDGLDQVHFDLRDESLRIYRGQRPLHSAAIAARFATATAENRRGGARPRGSS